MKAYMMQQYSPEWWEIRRGVPTASCFDKIITAKEGNLSKSAKKYMSELLGEVAQPSAPFFSERGTGRALSKASQNGIDTEAEARRWYAMEMDADVQQVGFCVCDAETYGCSPDGVVGMVLNRDGTAKVRGVQELKCPEIDTHFEWLMEGVLPLQHKVQCHGELAVTGADYLHFVSYVPNAQGLIITVEPDAYTRRLKEAVEEFVGNYLEAAKKLGVILKRPRPVVGLAEEPAF